MAMSLQPQEIAPVPEDTQRIARAAFPKGNIYVRMRDEIGTIFDDPMFAPLFPARGQPAENPWRLALITVMQFVVSVHSRVSGVRPYDSALNPNDFPACQTVGVLIRCGDEFEGTARPVPHEPRSL